MSASTSTLPHAPFPAEASGPADDAGLRSRARLERQLDVLDRLAEVGLDVAEALGRQARDLTTGLAQGAAPGEGADETDVEPAGDSALDDAPSCDAANIALAYARVARAVRLTYALQSRLVDDFHTLGQTVARARSEADAVARRARPERVQTVARIVERLIDTEVEDQDRVQEVADAATRWLTDESLSGALDRPFSAIVADICRDLGLHPDWAMLAQEGWARDEVAGRGPGVPPPPVAAAPARSPWPSVKAERAALKAANAVLNHAFGKPPRAAPPRPSG